jgi:CRP/FNR family cyclic AMP-dependent transcriptional regulator
VARPLDDVIADTSFFEGMTSDALALIAGCGSNVGFGPGEQLFREGEPADTFYVVRRGTVAIETFVPTRGAVTIETIEAGDVLGWSWVFPPHRWHFDGRAVTEVRATAFDGACLRGKCEADPALGYELMKRFAQVFSARLAATRLRLLDVYGRRGG